jgi:hypothetical protein
VTQLQYDMAHMRNSVQVSVQENESPHVALEQVRRKAQKKKKKKVKANQNDDDVAGGGGVRPVQWFGLFPNEGMRSAEKHFVESLKLAIEASDRLIETQRLCSLYLKK